MAAQPLFVVSPHLDDAVLSIGGELRATPGSIVATVCSAFPNDGEQATPWDAESGFESAHQAVVARRREDKRALDVLSAGQLLLDLVDGQYGQPKPHTTIVDALLDALSQRSEFIPVGPLGLEHPDHLATADAFLDAMQQLDTDRFWLYAEIPYYREFPDQARRRLKRLGKLGFRIAPAELNVRSFEQKAAAVACYSSQVSTFRGRDVDAAELVWRVSRSGSDDLPGSLGALRSNVTRKRAATTVRARVGRWRRKLLAGRGR